MKMATVQTPVTLPILTSFSGALSSKRVGLGHNFILPTTSCSSPKRPKLGFLLTNEFKMKCSAEKWPIVKDGLSKDWILMRNRRRVGFVVVRASGFNGGGGDKNSNTRVLVNLGLAVGLTYLTMTGQLGWILDAIVSIWLLAVLLPIAGLVAFFWFAGRDLVQSSCPNCGNDLQIFKSSSKDGLQICPYCSRPFSVQGDKFVRESDRFTSNSSSVFGQYVNEEFPSTVKGKTSSTTTVDIEAEVKDID